MQIFGNHIKKAGNYLSEQIAEAVISSKDIAQGNELLSKNIEKYGEQLITEHEKIEQTIIKLNSLVNNADNAFVNMKEHQENFLSNLKENVEQLSKQMTQLLKDYSERANSQTENHLKLWVQNSTDYAAKMNTAVNAIANVVDDMEDNINKMRS